MTELPDVLFRSCPVCGAPKATGDVTCKALECRKEYIYRHLRGHRRRVVEVNVTQVLTISPINNTKLGNE